MPDVATGSEATPSRTPIRTGGRGAHAFRARLAVWGQTAAAAAAGAVLSAAAGCESERSSSSSVENDAMNPRPIEEVVDTVAPEWMTWDGVTMVYVSADDDGRPAVKVGVVSRPHEVESRIPPEIEGWPVIVVESGEVKPLGR
jgi:hypothetical protein